MKHIKRRVYEIIEFTGEPFSINWFYDALLITMVILNAAAIMLESIEDLYITYSELLINFEILSVVFFAADYFLRLWSITENPHFQKPLIGRLKYMITPMAIIDLLAFFPYFIAMYAHDFDYVKFFAILRFFRFLKVVRYIKAVKIFGNVLRNKRHELSFSFVFVLFILLLVSTLMYYVERDAQPDDFKSIPHAMWWAIATLTTVGYGDVVPVTVVGKMLGGIIAILGIGLVAIPSGIMAAGFIEEIRKEREQNNSKHFCPYCGNHLD
jgi:voltage-gated potassium channel